jgi:hypothetical protein
MGPRGNIVVYSPWRVQLNYSDEHTTPLKIQFISSKFSSYASEIYCLEWAVDKDYAPRVNQR